MANILKSNSARIALGSITQSLAAASSSVRFLHSCRARDREITPPFNWGVVVVDFSKVYIIERYGKYVKTLPPGIHYLIPLVDRIAYVHSIIKNQSIEIPAHLATTKDNVPIYVEGLLFFEIVDPVLASYEVETTLYDDVIQLAQTTMRSQVGKVILHNYFWERRTLDAKILESINVVVKSWGVKCSKYWSSVPATATVVEPDSED